METLTTIGETVLVVIAGLTLRALIALAGLAIIVLPILGVFMLVRASGSLALRLQGFARAGHVLLRRGVFYAPGHTWIKEETAKAVRVGLDGLAQRILAGAGSFRLAEPGTYLRRGDTLAEVVLAQRTARVPAPVDGTVVQVNEAVRRSPDLVRHDPYRRGWLAVLTVVDTTYRRLPTGTRARQWLEVEDRCLTAFFESQLGAAAADGGDFIAAPPTLLSDAQWRELAERFLEASAPLV